MVDLLGFKRSAIADGLCGKYKKRWDNARNKRDLMDIALDANGVPYLAETWLSGWGLSSEYILREFGSYVNGEYVMRHFSGYTSELYVGVTLVTGRASTTLTGLFDVGSNEFKIPARTVREVHVWGKSNIRFTGKGSLHLYVYGDDCNIAVEDTVKVCSYKKSRLVDGKIEKTDLAPMSL